jgi:hypothetical protein
MRYDLGQLRVDKLIVHELPRHLASEAVSQPILSDIESPLTMEVKNFFREKIAGTLGSEAYDVEFDPDMTSPVPNLVSDNLGNGTTDFVVMSQEVARHLHQCQGGINPEGLLTVVQVRVENRRAFASSSSRRRKERVFAKKRVTGRLRLVSSTSGT